jgi:hypothetical protein
MRTNRLDEILNALETNRQSFARRVEELRRDNHYSEYGRADLIAGAWDEAKLKHESLKDELNEHLEDERAHLERSAFAPPKGQEQNYRDAIAKASAVLDRSEREKMFELAVKTNDTVQLRAIAAVSHLDGSWTTIQQAAKFDKDISALVDFERNNGVLRTSEDKLTANVMLRTPTKPAEYSQANVATARDASR